MVPVVVMLSLIKDLSELINSISWGSEVDNNKSSWLDHCLPFIDKKVEAKCISINVEVTLLILKVHAISYMIYFVYRVRMICIFFGCLSDSRKHEQKSPVIDVGYSDEEFTETGICV